MSRASGSSGRQRPTQNRKPKAADLMPDNQAADISASQPAAPPSTQQRTAMDVERKLSHGDSGSVDIGEAAHREALEYWMSGDWDALRKLDINAALDEPQLNQTALLIAAAHFAGARPISAWSHLKRAGELHCDRERQARLLIAGIHNTLGRACALSAAANDRARAHFASSLSIAYPTSCSDRAIRRRMQSQLVGVEQFYGDGGLTTSVSTFKAEATATQATLNSPFFSSSEYWESRYRKGGNSGNGSYGRLAQFKAGVVNKFINDHKVKSVIELGCGDGNQLSLLCIEKYIGVDASARIIQQCKSRFSSKNDWSFFTTDEFSSNTSNAEATLSLDVIFHLVEDEIFAKYMTTLFARACRYCLIYSSNDEKRTDPPIHVRHRKFTDWIQNNAPDWKLRQIIFNPYPHDGTINSKETSFCDFYIYERQPHESPSQHGISPNLTKSEK